MSIPPNISRNRLKFSDNENKVLVKNFSELVDNQVINDAKEAITENALLGMEAAKSALKGLQDPLDSVKKALEGGAVAKELLGSIKSSLPDLQAVSQSVNSVIASGQQQAAALTQSVMGSINDAVAQVPAVIGNLNQISEDVKAQLLKTSVAGFASDLNKEVRAQVASVSNTLNTAAGGVSPLQKGAAQAVQSIQAAKSSFTSYTTGPFNLTKLTEVSNRVSNFNVPVFSSSSIVPAISKTADTVSSLSSSYNKAMSSLITQNISAQTGAPPQEFGTSSQLLPIANNNLSSSVVTPVLPEMNYSDKAFTTLLAGVSWYRSLYAYLFALLETSKLEPVYGTAQDHYAVISGTATDLQIEQTRNFETLVSTNTPSNPAKNLYVYKAYQALLALLVVDIPTLTDNSRIQSVLAHTGMLLTSSPIKPLMEESDYRTLSESVASVVYSAKVNKYDLQDQSEYNKVYSELYEGVITDAVINHRSAGVSILKRVEAPSEITLFCAVWLIRSILQEYITVTDSHQRSRLIKALKTIYSTPIEGIEYQWTDFHGLVLQGTPVYWKPSHTAFSLLTFPFIKHYTEKRTEIKAARSSLANELEKKAFDALTLRLDTLVDSGIPEIKNIIEDTSSINYPQLSSTHLSLGAALSLAVINNNTYISDANAFPERSFEMYYATPDHLYFDSSVSQLR